MIAGKRTAVRIEGLSYSYRSRRGVVRAVRGVSFEVKLGEVLSIVGSSGSGKSTLLHMISRLIASDEGSIQFPAFETPLRIGYMFQSNCTFPWRTVERNITYAMEIRGARPDER